jgi:hypothetical protein
MVTIKTIANPLQESETGKGTDTRTIYQKNPGTAKFKQK